jgi:uncharacterized protein (TIGR02444 family)
MGTAADPSELDTSFWAFSIAVYAGDGVAEECLSLQERLELDVNLLLFAAYMGAAEGVALTIQDISAASAAIADWHGEVVRPLRRVRRALKQPSLEDGNPLRAADAALRLQVKRAELDAEKIEQAMLWQWSRQELGGRTRNDGALGSNVRGVLAFYGDADAPSPRLIEASLAYAAR